MLNYNFNRRAKRLLNKLNKKLIQTPLYGSLDRWDNQLIFPITERLRKAQRRHTELKLNQVVAQNPELSERLIEALQWSEKPIKYHYYGGMMAEDFDDLNVAYTAWIYDRTVLRHRKVGELILVEKSWAHYCSEFLEVLAGTLPF